MDEVRNYDIEEEINLKKLILYVLRKWRLVLVVAVIFGLLVGGIKTAKGFLDLRDPEKVEESIRESDLALQNYETAKNQLTNQMAEYNRQLDDYQKYQDNSLYMKIDPYAVYKESVTYVVTTDYQILPNMTYQALNWMGPVLSAYTSVATSVSLKDLPPEGRENLSEEWDADSLEKLIRVETKTEDGKLMVTVSAESENRAKAIMKAVKERIEENRENVAQAAGEHNLTLISEKSEISVDQDIINYREQRLRNITSLREAADKALEKYNKLSKPENGALSPGNIVKNGVKFGILGTILGGLLAFGWFAVCFLMDGIVHDPETVRSRFQTKVLELGPDSDRNDVVLSVIAAGLEKTCEGKNVILIGSCKDADIQKIIDKLGEFEKNIRFSCVGNVLTAADAANELNNADIVMLAEQKEVSKIADIQRELELLRYLKKPVEGIIIF